MAAGTREACKRRGAVAHLGERGVRNAEVEGSSPSSSTRLDEIKNFRPAVHAGALTRNEHSDLRSIMRGHFPPPGRVDSQAPRARRDSSAPSPAAPRRRRHLVSTVSAISSAGVGTHDDRTVAYRTPGGQLGQLRRKSVQLGWSCCSTILRMPLRHSFVALSTKDTSASLVGVEPWMTLEASP